MNEAEVRAGGLVCDKLTITKRILDGGQSGNDTLGENESRDRLTTPMSAHIQQDWLSCHPAWGR
jgi:hypothetical protein